MEITKEPQFNIKLVCKDGFTFNLKVTAQTEEEAKEKAKQLLTEALEQID